VSHRLLSLKTLAAAALASLRVGVAWATPLSGNTNALTGAPITFGGFTEGTLIGHQFTGVTFGQFPLGGLPQIDNAPFLFGFTSNSGVAVLTGSTAGGEPFPTVAGLTATFASAQSSVEFFLSDTGPLGTYLVEAFGAGNALLESLVVAGSDLIDGQFVGFLRSSADILMVRVDSNVSNDAFAIDDVRFGGAQEVPEPTVLLLVGLGLTGAAILGNLRKP